MVEVSEGPEAVEKARHRNNLARLVALSFRTAKDAVCFRR
jgi:hypothetical protein